MNLATAKMIKNYNRKLERSYLNSRFFRAVGLLESVARLQAKYLSRQVKQ